MRSVVFASLLPLAVAASCDDDKPAAKNSDTLGDGGRDHGGDGATGADGSTTPPLDAGPIPNLPEPICTPPVSLVPLGASPVRVGTGTPDSCTEAALHAAVAAGGVIAFDCGPSPATIALTAPLAPPTGKDTTIDGEGKVTLSGDGKTRIFELIYSFEKASPTLTVQRLTLTKGRSTDVANTTETTHGGAAIYTLGGNVTVIDSLFTDNHGPDTGQDVAGGAIYNVGAGSTVVVGSRFVGNTASNGGAIGALGSNLTVINSTLSGNSTTGMGGNPGNGGNGGGIVMDGKGKNLALCGTVLLNNQANAFGGGVFRTSYENEPTNIDKSVFDANKLADAQPQAAVFIPQGTHVTLTQSTVVNGQARFAAGISIYEHGQPAPGIIDMTNVTIANNATYERTDFTTRGLVGGITVGDRVTGTWKNVTIVGNAAQFASGVGGASNRLTIQNSVIHNDAKNLYTPLNCNGTSANGDHDLQFPANNSGGNDLDCVTGIQKVDPKFGPLVGNDGEQKVRRPTAGSPALGLGVSCPPTDQLGKARPATGCTAGAVEGI